ncbi:TetR/AcrR family transcriptional regulator [Deminuibacter soli]|uniref:TetR/AcrR family transcriptional regulator n=1 Tax=Deminuibacter soli TaxID=2291815 RepID=A0A3E1NCS3_9BACT|nr:TetR/AcrR family transcriptional regulator [Deminuibacter soli]RFM25786.1 TetR/AcrR family transcriptional regulator [Deminuibacter soli]
MRPRNEAKENAIRSIALEIIAKEGLENLSMQKLAKAANISPRTIYIKYESKDDLLIKLFINDVLGAYEQAVLKDFNEDIDFVNGVQQLWNNAFAYLTANRHAFALIQYGKSSPLLNNAFKKENIIQGQFFAPVHRFLEAQVKAGTIRNLPQDVHRALLFSPLLDLVNEYFDHAERPVQIITQAVLKECCEAVTKGMMKP